MLGSRISGPDLRRLMVVTFCLVFGLAVVVTQLVRYQVVRAKELKQIADAQVLIEKELAYRRGTITDAGSRVLAMDIVQWDISASPPLVTRPEEVAAQLSALLEKPAGELLELLTTDLPWVPLARQVPQETGEAILALHASGVACEPRPLRVYPVRDLTCHVIGIVNETGEGFYGVEGYHNKLLSPTAATRQIKQDPVGQELPMSADGSQPAATGTSLVLTLDLNIQYIAEQELQNALKEYGAEKGTVIVMDPRTGAILASVSSPGYDPNDFASSEVGLLRDPAVSAMWEPGSIFKTITWAAALDAGTITPETVFEDDGSIEVGGRIIQNWDRMGHGTVTAEEALTESLNTVAAAISTALGKERFYLYLRRFGMGSITDVDLAIEGPGMIKLPGDANWFPSDLGTNSFGQGIATTPLQIVTAVSAVANGGLLMKPYIVSQYVVQDVSGQAARVIDVEPAVVRRAVSQEAAMALTDMMVHVVEQGTKEARVPGYRIAGKSGTAQVPMPYGYHATDTIGSFIGYAPADNPQFIVLVKLDKPKSSPWGSQTAAPTFRAIAQRLFLYLQIPPDATRLADMSSNRD